MNNFILGLVKFCNFFCHVFPLGFAFFLSFNLALAGDINLAWDASPSDGVAGYKLFYGSASNSYQTSIDVGNVTSYQIAGLTSGNPYFFAIKAYNAAKSIESTYSNEVSVTVPAMTTLTSDFTPNKTSGPAPLIVTFIPKLTETISELQWSFGTSSIPTSVAQIPTVTFPNSGIYLVDLAITGSSGGITKITKQITVTGQVESQALVKASASASSYAPGQIKSAVQAAVPIQEPAPKPVAAFGFEERAGATVRDLSGRGNHGKIKQAVRVKAGRYGKALKFDGVNDWVTVKHSQSLNLSKGYTIEAWVKPSSIRKSSVIVKQQPQGSVYDLFAYEDHDLPSTSLNDGINYSVVNGLNQLPVRQWAHLASTFDGINQRLYINGVEVASVLTKTSFIYQSNDVLRIGGNSVWGDFFHGCIDEVKIYDRALTPEDIQKDLSSAISPRFRKKLVVK
jgi:PKD repeat protein